MISHSKFTTVMQLGSCLVYSVLEYPTQLGDAALRYYWYDSTTPQSQGPYVDVNGLMLDYAQIKQHQRRPNELSIVS